MAEYGGGMPMNIGDPASLWKGSVRTNGILMGDVNSRVPALTEGFSAVRIDAASPLYTPDIVPWGHGVWREVGEVDTRPGVRYTQAPAVKPLLTGVFKFNQGWQASNPIQPYGMPSYSTGVIIRQGLVGYAFAMTAVGQGSNYLKYIQGDKTQDVPGVRTLYADWMAAWKGAAAGSWLALFFEDNTGFPIVAVVTGRVNPVLTGASFGGFLEVIAKEYERVYFDIRL
jgi:hypothetical protein